MREDTWKRHKEKANRGRETVWQQLRGYALILVVCGSFIAVAVNNPAAQNYHNPAFSSETATPLPTVTRTSVRP